MKWFALIVVLLVTFVAGVRSHDYGAAVFTALSRSMHTRRSSINPVLFDYVGVDTKRSFNPHTRKLYLPQTGVYWIAVSHGISPGQDGSAYIMNGDNKFASSYRLGGSYLNGVDTMSRDIMMLVTRRQFVHIMGYSPTSSEYVLYSDKGLQTSLTLFTLTSLMRTRVMFSAVRESDTNGSVNEIIQFPRVLVNEGNAFNSATGIFTAPKDGLYFLSYSVGIKGGLVFDSVIRHNTFTLGTLRRLSTTAYDKDTLSRAGMYILGQNDVVYISINKASHIWSNSDCLATSFSGFLYDPIHNKKVAWSVAKTVSWFGETLLSPVPFEDILVNEGGYWLTSRQFFICPVTGIYYITLTAGAHAYLPVHLTVVVDMQPKIVLNRDSRKHNGTDMLSRSALLFLEVGSQVAVRAEAYTALHSTQERQTTFAGFLLFPSDKPKN